MPKRRFDKLFRDGIRIVILFWCFYFTSQPAFGQDYLSLDQAVEIGLQNNYDLTIARNEAQIAENNASPGNAGMLPGINASANQSKSVANTKQIFLDGRSNNVNQATSDSKSAQIALDWTIFDGFKMFTSYGQLQELKKVGEIQASARIEDMVAGIINAYYNIVQLNEQLGYFKESFNISRERLTIAQNNFQIGAGSKLDVLKARVDLNADSAALLQQQTALENGKIELNQLLSRKPETPFTTADSIIIQTPLQLSKLKETAGRQNTDLLLARRNHQVARLNLKEVRSEWLPQVNLSASYDWSKFSSESGFLRSNQSNGYTYGAGLSINLFNGFNTWRKTQNAKIAIRNSELRLRQLQIDVDAQISKLFSQYDKSLQIIRMEEENLKIAKESVDISFQQYKLGSISSIDLRESQRNYLGAENRYVTAKYAAKTAETELRRLSGLLLQQESE